LKEEKYKFPLSCRFFEIFSTLIDLKTSLSS
jgi:hypothetical protein